MKILGIILLVAVSCAAQIINPSGSSGSTVAQGQGIGLRTSAGTTTLVSSSPTSTAVLCDYRLDEGSGTTIKDYSGNGNDGTLVVGGTPSGPTWSSGVLTFASGNTGYVQAATACNTAGTIEIWVAPDTANPPPVAITLFGRGNLQGAAGWMSSNGRHTLLDLSAEANIQNSADANQSSQITAVSNVKQMITYTFSTGASSFTANNQATIAFSAGYATAITTNNYRVGATTSATICSVAGNCELTGKLYAVRFLTGTLANQQISADYNFGAQLQLGRGIDIFNTVSATTPIYICDGDSTVQGASGTFTPWCTGISLNVSPTVYNTSLSGQTAVSTTENVSWRSLPLIAPQAQTNITSIGICTNDINNGGTAASCYIQIMNWVRKQNALGVRPIVQTIMSFASHDTDKKALNLLIRNGAYSTDPAYFYAIADIAAIPGLGADAASGSGGAGMATTCGASGAFSSACFQTDNVHETTTAATNQIKPLMQNVINSLDNTLGSVPASFSSVHSMAANEIVSRGDTTGGNFTLTMIDCIGLTGQTRLVKNVGTANTLTVAAPVSTIIGSGASGTQEKIDGANSITLTAGKSAILKVILSSVTGGGCQWEQQN